MLTAINADGKRLVFMTMPSESGTFIELSGADENYMAVGESIKSLDPRAEEDYHTALRKDAAEKGHLVKQYCTDPELNPK